MQATKKRHSLTLPRLSFLEIQSLIDICNINVYIYAVHLNSHFLFILTLYSLYALFTERANDRVCTCSAMSIALYRSERAQSQQTNTAENQSDSYDLA